MSMHRSTNLCRQIACTHSRQAHLGSGMLSQGIALDTTRTENAYRSNRCPPWIARKGQEFRRVLLTVHRRHLSARSTSRSPATTWVLAQVLTDVCRSHSRASPIQFEQVSIPRQAHRPVMDHKLVRHGIGSHSAVWYSKFSSLIHSSPHHVQNHIRLAA